MTVNKYVALLLLGTSLYSCSSTRQIKKCERCFKKFADTATVIIDSVSISYDTIQHIVEVAADTTIEIVLIECDTLGNASISSISRTNGNRSNINTSLQNNQLTLTATCNAFIDSIEILNKKINTIKETTITNIVEVPTLVEAELNWWQKIKITYGGFAFAFIALFLGYKGLSLYAKTSNPLAIASFIIKKFIS